MYPAGEHFSYNVNDDNDDAVLHQLEHLPLHSWSDSPSTVAKYQYPDTSLYSGLQQPNKLYQRQTSIVHHRRVQLDSGAVSAQKTASSLDANRNITVTTLHTPSVSSLSSQPHRNIYCCEYHQHYPRTYPVQDNKSSILLRSSNYVDGFGWQLYCDDVVNSRPTPSEEASNLQTSYSIVDGPVSEMQNSWNANRSVSGIRGKKIATDFKHDRDASAQQRRSTDRLVIKPDEANGGRRSDPRTQMAKQENGLNNDDDDDDRVETPLIDDHALVDIQVRQMNSILKHLGVDKDVALVYKKRRRRLKNRLYASQCRQKRVKESLNLRQQNDMLKGKIADLEAGLRNIVMENEKLRFALQECDLVRSDLVSDFRS